MSTIAWCYINLVTWACYNDIQNTIFIP